jgi:hypothetical protein
MKPEQEESEFLQAAAKELHQLVREVEDDERRHGPRPRTTDQDVALVVARLDALEQDRLALLDDLDVLLHAGEEAEAADPVPIEDEAAWLKQARRELDKLIAETWGPQLKGNRGKPDSRRTS